MKNVIKSSHRLIFFSRNEYIHYYNIYTKNELDSFVRGIDVSNGCFYRFIHMIFLSNIV